MALMLEHYASQCCIHCGGNEIHLQFSVQLKIRKWNIIDAVSVVLLQNSISSKVVSSNMALAQRNLLMRKVLKRLEKAAKENDVLKGIMKLSC
jgi:hypothetical protein